MQPTRRTSRARLAKAAPTVALAIAVLLVACGPAQREAPPARSDTAASAGTASAPVARGTPMAGMPGMGGMGGMMGGAAAPASGSTTASTAPLACRAPDSAAIARGRDIFGHATCVSCHGPDARGTGIAPDLADRTWLDATGSEASIAAVIRAGVPHPRTFRTPMPPAGGSRLDSQQICDLAAWVYSLSH